MTDENEQNWKLTAIQNPYTQHVFTLIRNQSFVTWWHLKCHNQGPKRKVSWSKCKPDNLSSIPWWSQIKTQTWRCAAAIPELQWQKKMQRQEKSARSLWPTSLGYKAQLKKWEMLPSIMWNVRTHSRKLSSDYHAFSEICMNMHACTCAHT